MGEEDIIHIQATLPFMKEISGVKPYRIIGPLPAEHESKRTNVEAMEVADVTICNARLQQGQFSIDDHGFEFIRFEYNTQLVGDNPEAAQGFLEEVVTFLQGRFQTLHVFSYDLRIRSSEKKNFEGHTERMVVIPTAPVIHSDLTRQGALSRIGRHLHDHEKESMLTDDYRILAVNTWMPLDVPAIDRPLVIGDRRTFLQADVIPADQVFTDFLGEYSHPRPNEGQQWYWLDHQEPGEMTIFCSFDSSVPGDGGACPHGTFHNPRATFESPRRKSVETRSLIFLPGGNIPKKNELYGLGNSCPLWHIS